MYTNRKGGKKNFKSDSEQIYCESARLVLSKFNRHYLHILYVTNVNIAAQSGSILWYGGICGNIFGKKNHVIYFRRRVKHVHVKIYVCWWNFFLKSYAKQWNSLCKYTPKLRVHEKFLRVKLLNSFVLYARREISRKRRILPCMRKKRNFWKMELEWITGLVKKWQVKSSLYQEIYISQQMQMLKSLLDSFQTFLIYFCDTSFNATATVLSTCDTIARRNRDKD